MAHAQSGMNAAAIAAEAFRADARQRKHEVLEAHIGKSIVPKYMTKLEKEIKLQMLKQTTLLVSQQRQKISV